MCVCVSVQTHYINLKKGSTEHFTYKKDKDLEEKQTKKKDKQQESTQRPKEDIP